MKQQRKPAKDLDMLRGASSVRDQDVRFVRRVERTIRSNKEAHQRLRWVVGVDEAGRGPLAGPVAVGVAVVPRNFNWKLIPGVGDSKKVPPKRREEVVKIARALRRAGVIDFSVSLMSSSVIDTIGITQAVRLGIKRCFAKLALNPKTVSVKLDGLLTAPKEFFNQETIIKGDAKEKVIGLASILAKVTRDACMVRIACDYPEYGFEVHKGYGTEKHRTAIMKHGLSKVHRRSFCKNLRA